MKVFEELFFNLFNLLATSSFMGCLLYTLLVFREEVNIVNKVVYKSVVKVIYVLSILVTTHFINMLQILIFQVSLNINYIVKSINKEMKYLFIGTLGFVIYFILNILIPLFVIIKLTRLRLHIFKIGNLEGQDYSMASTMPAPTDREDKTIITRIDTFAA